MDSTIFNEHHLWPQNNDNPVFYYKMVAKLLGKYYSIYDGKTQYILGQTMYQEAVENHKGGFYVYKDIDEVIFADIPFKKGGLFIAPRTILKCLCWGKQVEYGNGKLSFSYICPIQDVGIPQGYKSSKEALREQVKRYEEKQKKKSLMKKPLPRPFGSSQAGVRPQRPASAFK